MGFLRILVGSLAAGAAASAADIGILNAVISAIMGSGIVKEGAVNASLLSVSGITLNTAVLMVAGATGVIVFVVTLLVFSVFNPSGEALNHEAS
jgi:hypothetical protein